MLCRPGKGWPGRGRNGPCRPCYAAAAFTAVMRVCGVEAGRASPPTPGVPCHLMVRPPVNLQYHSFGRALLGLAALRPISTVHAAHRCLCCKHRPPKAMPSLFMSSWPHGRCSCAVLEYISIYFKGSTPHPILPLHGTASLSGGLSACRPHSWVVCICEDFAVPMSWCGQLFT